MFYISSIKDNLYGITDATDEVEELYDYSGIMTIAKSGIKILRY